MPNTQAWAIAQATNTASIKDDVGDAVVIVTVRLLSNASRNNDRAEMRAIHRGVSLDATKAAPSYQSVKVSRVVVPCSTTTTFAAVRGLVKPWAYGIASMLATVPVIDAIIALRCKGASVPLGMP